MRENRLTWKRPAGETGVGALIAIRGPELVEQFGHLGHGDLQMALRA